MNDPTPPTPPAADLPLSEGTPWPPPSTSGSSRPLVPLLIGGIVLVGVLGLAALFVISSVVGGDGRSPEDAAVGWMEATVDRDERGTYDLLVPAQRDQLPYERWESCGLDAIIGDAEEEVLTEIEVLAVGEAGTSTVAGDGAKQYDTVEVTLRATRDDGSFFDRTLPTVKDGDSYYVSLTGESAYAVGMENVPMVFGYQRLCG